MGRPLTTLQDEFAFWAAAGYDHVTIQAGIRALLRPHAFQAGAGAQADLVWSRGLDVHKLFTVKRAAYAYNGGTTEQEWAPEGDGVITSSQEFARFPWPSPEVFDYAPFEVALRDLPTGLRVTAFLGWVFTAPWWLMGMEWSGSSWACTTSPRSWRRSCSAWERSSTAACCGSCAITAPAWGPSWSPTIWRTCGPCWWLPTSCDGTSSPGTARFARSAIAASCR
ncbi:MAG: hypothetical protein FJ029_03510 [Actinobacteria bacterium]|nr:hypothetical protein [Actinomycetota bacterium]